MKSLFVLSLLVLSLVGISADTDYIDCLNFDKDKGNTVTQLVSTTSDGSIAIQQFRINPGANCSIVHAERAKVSFGSSISSTYVQYLNSNCKQGNWTDTPLDQWYPEDDSRTCYTETLLINTDTYQFSELTFYLYGTTLQMNILLTGLIAIIYNVFL